MYLSPNFHITTLVDCHTPTDPLTLQSKVEIIQISRPRNKKGLEDSDHKYDVGPNLFIAFKLSEVVHIEWDK